MTFTFDRKVMLDERIEVTADSEEKAVAIANNIIPGKVVVTGGTREILALVKKVGR